MEIRVKKVEKTFYKPLGGQKWVFAVMVMVVMFVEIHSLVLNSEKYIQFPSYNLSCFGCPYIDDQK